VAEKICENVFLVGSSILTDNGDCMIYLVTVGDSVILIDAGTGRATEKLMKNIVEAGSQAGDISAIVLTHCHVDHIGGTNALRELTGAKVYAHEFDARAIEDVLPSYTVERYYGMTLDPIPVDVWLRGESGEFDSAPGLKWIHAPGHTPGSISLTYEAPSGETVLFGQDIHGPFEPGFGSDIRQWRKSMHKLLEINADILCEGHFGVFKPASEVRRFIEDYLEQYA